MRLPPTNELLAFQKVAGRLSFNQAAEELSLTPSTVSHLVRSLEERLKTRLLNRTTRSVSLTEAGQKLFTQLSPLLNHLNQVVGGIDQDAASPQGTVRISVSETAAPLVLERLDSKFRENYPNLHIELIVDNRLLDIVAEGFDVGVRLRKTVPKDMVAVPLLEKFRFVCVASPEYVRKNGLPKKPDELLSHNCIGFRFQSGRLYEWEFEKRGKKYSFDVKGGLTTNNPRLLLDAAKKGLGIANVAEALIAEEIATKKLLVLLDSWSPYQPGLYLYYPKNRHAPPALRTVINTLRENRSL